MRIPLFLIVLFVLALVSTKGFAAPATDAQRNPSFLDHLGATFDRADQGLEAARNSLGDRANGIVERAMSFLGVRYRRGGSSTETGFDCSGFVRAIYDQSIGLLLPRSAAQQAAGTEVINPSDLQPGDLVFYNTMRRSFSHVGIYIGDGKFVHSPRAGGSVRVDDMQESYWKKRFNGARRVVSESTTGAALAPDPASNSPSH